jgi:Xaa-Pro dipeptidase
MRRRDFLKSAAPAALIPFASTQALTHPPTQSRQSDKGKQFRDRIRPITKEERLERQEKARKLMHEQNIEALFFEGGVSLNYFTGVSWGRSERLFAMIFPRTGEPVFISPKFEESKARELIGIAKLLTWEEDENPYALVKTALQDNKLFTGTIGIEETTRYFIVENLARTASNATFTSGTPVTAGCRGVKSAHEIELMQIANDITAEVFKEAVATLKVGMKEREFGSIVSRLFREYGVGGGALVLFGEASAHPHGLEKEHALREGDIVLIDGGCSVEGYASDVTRTTVLGKPSPKMEKIWGIVRKAQDVALADAKPGVAAEAVDASARKVITDAGYGPDYKYFTHRLGHGIGMEGHEWYYLVRGSKRPLEAGNMFSNEPGIYLVGEFGIRLEDEMLITEKGARLLLPQAESLEKLF